MEPALAALALVVLVLSTLHHRRERAAFRKLAFEQRAALGQLVEELISLHEALVSTGAVERPAKPPPPVRLPPPPRLPSVKREVVSVTRDDDPVHTRPTVADPLAGVEPERPTSSATRTAEAFRQRPTLPGGLVAPCAPEKGGEGGGRAPHARTGIDPNPRPCVYDVREMEDLMKRFLAFLFAVALGVAMPGCDLGAGNCSLWNNNPNACPAGAQTQTCPILMNVTGTVTVWECNIPPQYCNGAPGENDGPLLGCSCVICQTSEQAAIASAQQILAMQSVSVDPSGPPLQCRGPLATLSSAYDTGSLFTVGECTQVTEATCKPCDDGQGGMLQSVGQYCAGDDANPAPPGGPSCCHGLSCEGPAASDMGTCEGTLQPCPQAQPNWQPLDTGTLRNICINNDVNGSKSQSGVTLNRTCGVAFETWVLKTMGWLPRWTTLIYSMARENKTGGLPKSVIPEQVLDQPAFMTWVNFPQSVFVEVKAVNGTLTLGTSQYQILGLLDGVNTWPQVPDAGTHAPPAVFFITTSNTTISQSPQQVMDQANMWNVAVWQQFVYYDANGGTNPNLSVGNPTNPNPTCINPAVYGSVSSYTIWPGSGPQNPLTWATIQEQDAVGAVQEPAPDSPAMVP